MNVNCVPILIKEIDMAQCLLYELEHPPRCHGSVMMRSLTTAYQLSSCIAVAVTLLCSLIKDAAELTRLIY